MDLRARNSRSGVTFFAAHAACAAGRTSTTGKHLRGRWGLAAILLAASGAIAGAPAALQPAPLSLADAVGVPIEADAPGCIVGAFDRDGIRLQRAAGLANMDVGTPVDADTRFELGSASKQFTAAALLLLHAEGRLRLTDPVGRHLPGLPPAMRAPTLEQLMRHTSGLPDYVALARLVLGPTLGGIGRRRAIELAASAPPAFVPGADFQYSNTGYLLLADVVAAASSMPFGAYLKQHLFDPLGMHDSEVIQASRPSARRGGYYTVGAEGVKDGEWRSDDGPGAWGVRSSLRDLERWHRALVQNTAPLHAVRRAMEEPARLSGGEPVAYGGGVFLSHYRGARTVRHSGRNNVEFMRFPEMEVAVAVLCARDDVDAEAAAERVADAVWPDRLAPQRPLARTVDYAALPGEYVDENGALFEILDDQGQLASSWGSLRVLEPGRLEVSPTTDGTTVELRRDGVRLHFNTGRAAHYRRVTPSAPSRRELHGMAGTYVHALLQLSIRIQAAEAGGAEVVFPDGRRVALRRLRAGSFVAGTLRIGVPAADKPAGRLVVQTARTPALVLTRVLPRDR